MSVGCLPETTFKRHSILGLLPLVGNFIFQLSGVNSKKVSFGRWVTNSVMEVFFPFPFHKDLSFSQIGCQKSCNFFRNLWNEFFKKKHILPKSVGRKFLPFRCGIFPNIPSMLLNNPRFGRSKFWARQVRCYIK